MQPFGTALLQIPAIPRHWQSTWASGFKKSHMPMSFAKPKLLIISAYYKPWRPLRFRLNTWHIMLLCKIAAFAICVQAAAMQPSRFAPLGVGMLSLRVARMPTSVLCLSSLMVLFYLRSAFLVRILIIGFCLSVSLPFAFALFGICLILPTPKMAYALPSPLPSQSAF